ncbi:MAG: hypothetical protein AB7O45_02715 [Alphaproteobacteria bacterium]
MVKLRMEILALLVGSPHLTERLNYNDLPDLMAKVEAQVTRRN